MLWRSLASVVFLALRSPTLSAQTAPQNLAFNQTPRGSVIDSISVLDRRISLNLQSVSVVTALDRIGEAAGVSVMIVATTSDNASVLETHRVSLHANGIAAKDALREALDETGFHFQLHGQAGTIVVEDRTDGSVETQSTSGGGVTGFVRDAQTREPLFGVAISIKGSSHRTLTSNNGRYALDGIPPGSYVLTARRLGYVSTSRSIEVPSGQVLVVDLTLSKSAAVLDQVVTTVTGDRTKRELGNLIATIPADSIVARTAVSDLTDVINGRVAGVQVYNTGGFTGLSPDINIRGQNSFSLANIPLLYIDGVRVENSTSIETSLGSVRAPVTGRLNDIDPNDIESIEVVKGPSAATLYGTDAANGVILVNTKHGNDGVATWGISGESGVLTDDKSRLIDPYYAWGHTTGSVHQVQQCMLLQVAAGSCVIDSVTHFDPLRVPTLSPIGTGYTNQLGLDVSGGISGTRYYASGRYEDEVSPTQLPDADRSLLSTTEGGRLTAAQQRPEGVFRVPVHATLVSPLGHSADLSVSASVLSENARNDNGHLYQSAFEGPGYRDSLDGWSSAFGRPSQVLSGRQLESIAHATISGTGTWRPQTWLSGHATAGYDFSYNGLDELIPPGTDPAHASGDRAIGKTDVTQITGDVGLAATLRPLSALSAKTSVGAQYNSRVEDDDQTEITNLGIGTSTLSGGSGTPFVSENTIETKTVGAYVQEELGLNDRLFVTGAVRADGAGAFGSAYNAAVYPKGSVSWLLSEEPFFPRRIPVSSLRLRGALGESGVQPQPTAALQTLQSQPYYVDGMTQTGAVLQTLGNPNLKPERQREYEAGADVGLFHDRVHFEGTYYHKQSSDALVSLPDAPQLGTYIVGGNTEYNVGSVLNWGYELLTNITVLDSRAIRVDFTVNGSINHNQLLKLAPGIDSNPGLNLRPGYPLFGIFAQPILSYRDANGNGIIEPNEVTVGKNAIYAGSVYPATQWSYGATVGLFGQSLKLSAFLDTRGGFVEYDPRYAQDLFSQTGQFENDPHTSLKDQAAYVAATHDGTLWGYLENGAFTRLREVSVSYTIPSSLTRFVRTRSATITLAARNLALWTRYRGVDPEIGALDAGNPAASGGAGAYALGSAGPETSQYWILRFRLGL